MTTLDVATDAATETATDTAIFERRESEVRSYCRSYDVVFERASGSHLTTTDGRTYIDFLAGCSSLNYGHNHPVLRDALVGYIAGDGLAHGLDMFTGAKRAFLETFERLILTPRGLDHVVQFTGPTGTNAVDAAMKLARRVTGRRNIVAFSNAFHGVTSGSLAATGNAGHRMDQWLSHHDVTRLPYDGYGGTGVEQLDLFDAMLNDPSGGIPVPAAFIVECVQGEGGLNAASPAWMQRLAEIARDHGSLLIVDDIQAGCGRTGHFFSFETLGVTPDIVTLSKSISGFGLPMSLVLLRPELDQWTPAQHNGTFRGNAHAFVTATAALETFWADDDLMIATARNADIVRDGLSEIADMVPGAFLKGRGMFRGVDVLDGDVAGAICARAFELGLVIETCGPSDQIVKVLAPLTTDEETLRAGLAILVEAARDVIAG